MGFWNQLGWLLWKNFTLRKRQKVRLVAEIVIPLVLFVALIGIRSVGKRTNEHECHFDSRSLPSMGLFSFLQTSTCNYRMSCHPTISDKEMNLPTESTQLAQAIRDAQIVLTDSSVMDPVWKVIQDLTSLNKFAESYSTRLNNHTYAIPMSALFSDVNALNTSLVGLGTVSGVAVATLLGSSINPAELALLLDNTTPGGSALLATSASDLLHGVFHVYDTSPAINWTSLSEIRCNSTSLQQVFIIDSASSLSTLTSDLCGLSEADAQNFFSLFDNNDSPIFIKAQLNQSINVASGRNLNYGETRDITDVMRAFWDKVLTYDSLAKVVLQDNNSSLSLKNIGIGEFLCGRNLKIFDSLIETVKKQYSNIRKYMQLGNSGSVSVDKVCSLLEGVLNLRSKNSVGEAYNYLQSMLGGKILYYPDNVLTRQVMAKMLPLFDDLQLFQNLTADWLSYSPTLKEFLQSGALSDLLRTKLPTTVTSNPVYDIIPSVVWPRNSSDTSTWAQFTSSTIGTTLNRWLKHTNSSQYDWSKSIEYTDTLMWAMGQFVECWDIDNKLQAFTSENSLISESWLLNKTDFWSAVIFDNLHDGNTTNATLPAHIQYRLRFKYDQVQTTKQLEAYFDRPGARNTSRALLYINYGFVFLQDMLDSAIHSLQTSGPGSRTGVEVNLFPYPCFINDSFAIAVNNSLVLFMIIAWVFTILMLVKEIVYEKEKRLKEVMRMMGLNNGVHWVAWFITSFAIMIITMIILVIVVKVGKIFQYADASLLFVFLLCYTASVIMMCFLFSTLFSKANLAAACSFFLYFMMYFVYSFLLGWDSSLGFGGKLVACLLNMVAFGYGVGYFSGYEGQGTGLQWSNVHKSPSLNDPFTPLWCIIMMLVDSVLYGILVWYIENVFPGEYGVPKRWYFPFTKTYWCGSVEEHSMGGQSTLELNKQHTDGLQMEKEPTNLPLGVQIHNLCKVYNGKKVAVDNLSLNFYEGQITSFLGHNGAGKTTTMSMLVGLFPPSKGTAMIYGQDIRSNMDKIRSSLGMCPQHNVLFDLLTVEEHLWFYARLRGADKEAVKRDTHQMLIDVDLPGKKDVLAKNLSGGMRRKLSIAIAFIGGSKTVILDEPTAGVDPYARRAIWDLMLKYREGRTIILSTHHMDEADILGDRIAIISMGKLRCCGSSLFLKDKFGSGYYLTLVKKMDNLRKESTGISERTLQDVTLENGDSKPTPNNQVVSALEQFDSSRVTSFIKGHIPAAKLDEDIGTEITYQLPEEAALEGCFQKLFRDLDSNLDTLGISSYGIQDTNLEEVFLTVSEIPEEELLQGQEMDEEFEKSARPASRMSLRRRKSVLDQEKTKIIEEKDVEYGLHPPSSQKVDGIMLKLQQFGALLVKRFHNMRRDIKGIVTQALLPVIFICLAMMIAIIVPTFDQAPSLELQPWRYTPSDTQLRVFYSNEDGTSFANTMEQGVTSKTGYGTRCMNTSSYHISDYPCKTEGVWSSIPSTVSTEQCSCSSGIQDCPAGAEGPTPSSKSLANNDLLFNLTGRNVTDFLIKTRRTEYYYKKRYGGFTFGAADPIVSVTKDKLHSAFLSLQDSLTNNTSSASQWESLATLLDNNHIQNKVKVWFNNKAYHGLPSYINAITNVLLRSNVGSLSSSYGTSVHNHPMNLTQEEIDDQGGSSLWTSIIIAVFVIFALSFTPASFVLFLISERLTNAKHLQFVSGVNYWIYWLSNYVWDFMNYILSALLCFIVFICFQQKEYTSSENAPCLFLLLVMYGWGVIPMMYPFCFVFMVPSTAFVCLVFFNILIGVGTTVTVFILASLEGSEDTNDALEKFFLMFPQYCLGKGLMDMASNQLQADLASKYGTTDAKSPFDFDLVGRNLLALFISGIGYFLIALLLQYEFFISKCKSQNPGSAMGNADANEDIDVKCERERVTGGRTKDDVLVVYGISKTYDTCCKKQVHAVKGISFGIPRRECFGLLGVNGAGKTSTFKMITGDVALSSGNATVGNHSVVTDLASVRKDIGYCPQFDALDPLLTGREHLQLYARLRGIPGNHVNQVSDWYINKMDLTIHADKISSSYSGGNKRKLSTALALIGDPSVIFLDEPTAGMDPKARRFLWNRIIEIIKDGRTIVLTSHSMEECEALCGRIAIMVNGTLKCFGSVQHLKNRFGSGYTLILRVAGHDPDLTPVRKYVQDTFPQSSVKQVHHNMLEYQLGVNVSLADCFEKMEMARKQFGIEDYSISQTTLEEVFINFAKLQSDTLVPPPPPPAIPQHQNNMHGNSPETRNNRNHSGGIDNQSYVSDIPVESSSEPVQHNGSTQNSTLSPEDRPSTASSSTEMPHVEEPKPS